MTATTPILITCVGGTMVPSALRWLRRRSRLPFEIHGVDVHDAPLAKAFLDAFHSVPMGEDPDYVATMLDIVERHGVKVVVPWSDGEAFTLSRARTKFENIGCAILTSPPDVMEVLRDKITTYQILQNAGLPVPEHNIIDRPADLDETLVRFGYPKRSVIVKPVDGRGGRGLFVLIGRNGVPDWLGTGARESRLNEEEYKAIDICTLITGKSMVMPCLFAPVYDADVLVRHGVVQATVVRRRHNPAGIPWTGNTICRNKEFEDYARAIAQALGLDGAHDVDLMSDSSGNPALLEVNPRMSGSLAATMAGGVSFLDAAIAGCLGIELPVTLPEQDKDVLPYIEAICL